MPNVPNKMQMPTAITSYSNQNLNGSHATTANIMELNVATAMELVPHQSINVSQRTFTRANPMPVPTFGDCYIHNRAFFVPFRTIMPEWNEFITDTSANSSSGLPVLVSSTPLLPNSELVKYFEVNSEGSATLAYDINIIQETGIAEPRKLTPRGARALKILTALGYAVDFNKRNEDANYSALNILALAKVYLDWYYPSVYITDYEASQVQILFEKKTSSLGAPYSLTYVDLDNIFLMIERVCYDADYFTSAWDNPVAPTSLTYSSISINDVTDPNSPPALETDPNGTPRIKSTYNLTQYGDDALHALTDYMKRHQMSGARVLDRYLARFGVTLDSAILDRSIYLGSHTGMVDFGNVTSTANSDGTPLGGYAGIGVGGSDGAFTYKSDEYGLFIILSSIVTRGGYYQGCDRMTMHTSKLDFYTPEFDNLGVQALATRELYVPLDAVEQYADGTNILNAPAVDYNGLVFGFVPRYAEYKRGRDILSGDYRLGSRNSGKDAWYLYRDLTPYFKSLGVANAKHSVDFLQSADADQYGRIFYNTDDSVDQFNILHLFNIKSRFPGKSLYDSYEFEDEDKAPKVSMDVNGVKAN